MWDTPGLGGSPENDGEYAAQTTNALKARSDDGDLLIDEVLVLIDGASKDLGTTYELMENVVTPYPDDPNRIVVAINQCDAGIGVPRMVPVSSLRLCWRKRRLLSSGESTNLQTWWTDRLGPLISQVWSRKNKLGAVCSQS